MAASRKPTRIAVADLPVAVAYRRSWLTDEQYAAAMTSAAESPVPSMRLRAQLSRQAPEAYVYLRHPDGAWQILPNLYPSDLGSVRIATDLERRR